MMCAQISSSFETYSPTLRWPLNIEYAQINGEMVCVIKDPSGLCRQPVVVPNIIMPIIARFDGLHSICDIAKEGQSVGLTVAFVAEVAEFLDEFFLLDSTHSRLKWEQIVTDFSKSKVRMLSHAGQVYSANRDELKAQLHTYLVNRDKVKIGNDIELDRVHTIIAPHIDYSRGGKTYGQVCNILEQIPMPDIVVLLGTSHQYSKSPFILTNKAFQTPFGIMPSAYSSINEIAELCKQEMAYDVFESEVVHRVEHSLDLQLPILGATYENYLRDVDESINRVDSEFYLEQVDENKYLGPSVIPILVGSFYEFVESKSNLCEVKLVEGFCNCVASVLQDAKRNKLRVLLYCGVDLSHVGTIFGDLSKITKEGLYNLKQHDLNLISKITSGDALGLNEAILQTGDKFRVCGFPTLYVALRVLELMNEPVKGHCLEYRQATEEKNDCTVSFFAGVLQS